MPHERNAASTIPAELAAGCRPEGVVADWSSDQRAFKNVPWGKAMMWIFLLSDTFIFSCFLISYMTVRMSTTVPWPNPSEVFALTIGGKNIPLILIAIMTFVLISSSGTMALAVNYGYRKDRVKTVLLLLATAALGATFVGMQAFEWTKLIVEEGVRPWGNPMGAAQFGSSFFMITGFHGTHVSIGVIFLIIVAIKVLRGDLDRRGRVPDRQEATTRSSRPWACTGTSSIWCGYSSSRSSISGRTTRHMQNGTATATAQPCSRQQDAGQQHPLGIYFKIWGLLFVLSTLPTWSTTSTSRATCGGR